MLQRCSRLPRARPPRRLAAPRLLCTPTPAARLSCAAAASQGCRTAVSARAATSAAAAAAAAAASVGWLASVRCETAKPQVAEPNEPPVLDEFRLYDKKGRLQLRVLAGVITRCLELCVLFGPVVLVGLLLHTPLHTHVRERWLRLFVASLARCGPVGIKWGQWASTRYDLFEDDVCEALGELVNQAPSHPFEHTRRLVEAAFGARVPELFASFDEAPIASGSIGQVHKATLKATGQPVAVKVQHPGLAERLPTDMAILRAIAALTSRVPGLRDLRVHETIDQFATNFMYQLDFYEEAHNLRTFAANFASPFWAALVSFPAPIDGLVRRDVLVETYEEGTSIAAYLAHEPGAAPAAAEDALALPAVAGAGVAGAGAAEQARLRERLRTSIAFVGLQAFLKMLIYDNFIHADLHPGNVLIRFEEIGWVARLQRFIIFGNAEALAPHMVLLDAGLAASFDARISSNVGSFFSSIINFRGVEFAEAILGMAPTQPLVVSREDFIREVAAKMAVMQAALNEGQGRAGENIKDFMVSVRAHRVLLDPSIMVSLMSMMVLEGWQFRLDPECSVFDNVRVALGGFGGGALAGHLWERLQNMFGLKEKSVNSAIR